MNDGSGEDDLGSRRKRSLLTRALLMIVMAVAYQLCGMLLFVVSVAQLLFALLAGRPSPHLLAFGASLARYYRQNVEFLTFVAEDPPFPFSPWPSSM